MADEKQTTFELGPNMRFVLMAILFIVGQVVTAWIGTDAAKKADAARQQSERNNDRIKSVGRDVREVQNDRRVIMGKPPLPVEPETDQ